MPIYEYKCRACGAVSEYLEKPGEWHLFPRKCKHCGRRRTKKVVSSFFSSVRRSRTETLNELKQMGNVSFVPRPSGQGIHGPPPGGCPYEPTEPTEEDAARPDKPRLLHADKG